VSSNIPKAAQFKVNIVNWTQCCRYSNKVADWTIRGSEP